MTDEAVDALVIGAGPAGLMAAETLAAAGRRVVIAEAKPSAARKLLMAGKSGLNLTRDEAPDAFLAAYGDDWLAPMLTAFGPRAAMDWAEGLGQTLFTGSTGRVFPEVMKASPLLRAWLSRIPAELRLRWRWTRFDGDAFAFDTPDGHVRMTPEVTVLALGGASWRRLGSDGAWAPWLQAKGVALSPFAASNAGVAVDWSDHMARHFGSPVKGIRLRAGGLESRGEIVLSARGIEGGGVYPLSSAIRDGAPLVVDLLPDLSMDEVVARLARPRGRESLSNHLRKALGLDGARAALLNEFARPLSKFPEVLAATIKGLTIEHRGLRPMDEAISTAGGIAREALTDGLMLRALPGVFAAGEMLDWDAPTGGYLLTACLASGQWAGRHAADYARASATTRS
ncbi:TIGR03862 family flavoprotein [Rhodobacterales bacterium HKCCE3408]|nr:TIGR03862 family flavoprotein [Rhodobacterales bacterium HKCCE3408]